jgi:hypothetical protein
MLQRSPLGVAPAPLPLSELRNTFDRLSSDMIAVGQPLIPASNQRLPHCA